MHIDRRELIAVSAALLGAAGAGRARAQHAPDRLVLLGTKGGPAVRAHAPSPSSTLLVINGLPHVIDTGYGVTFKLIEAGLSLPSLRRVFITHHHSDHNLEFGGLLYNAWAVGLRTEVDAYGPIGLRALAEGSWAANRFDIETRMVDEGRPDLRKLVRINEYAEGVVLDEGGVRVTALRNKHPPIVESYALKFAFRDKTVVFSGDTAYLPSLADFARGADVLIHEVMYVPAIEALVQRNPNAATLLAHLKASHTSTEDVGRIAAQAGVKKLVLNHFVPADDRSLTDQVWADSVRRTFSGEIVVGRDLLEIPL